MTIPFTNYASVTTMITLVSEYYTTAAIMIILRCYAANSRSGFYMRLHFMIRNALSQPF